MSSTLDRVDWNAELVRGDLGKVVQRLKRESGKGLFVALFCARPHLVQNGGDGYQGIASGTKRNYFPSAPIQ